MSAPERPATPKLMQIKCGRDSGGIMPRPGANEARVSRDVVSVEIERHTGSVPEWAAVLSRHVAQVPEALRGDEVTTCIPATRAGFRGRLEYGTFGDAVLFKACATPNQFSRWVRKADSSVPSPVLLFIQLSGSHRFRQSDRLLVLRPGDWCLLDTFHRIDCWTINESAELLGMTLRRPSDPEQIDLLLRGGANRFDGNIGTSRVLQKTLIELFAQMDNVAPSSGSGLRDSVTIMVWDAVREQLANPSPLLYRDIQASRLKAYVESQLSNPALSVEAIAQACGLSVRSVHRIFVLDRAGSVSAYIWRRRLERCAEALRDRKEARRSIAEICLHWGFHSTSHFSRVFRKHFGVPPRTYRTG
ncbi:MAG: helix-turn-helix domain-containing protein [Bradyrhizobium sp.]|uniref:helix-turn-helix domain-containing protein n=1 Tax=Bradyrhizobium sp. TaxID=376 RepID=UPI0025C6C187|nr:helix-turn-helix domain-containing protein [Bradyrhizobium sp.]MBI5264023.1 helix-turn-helix domain-containing protein [Bradyrhizobium sp.]